MAGSSSPFDLFTRNAPYTVYDRVSLCENDGSLCKRVLSL